MRKLLVFHDGDVSRRCGKLKVFHFAEDFSSFQWFDRFRSVCAEFIEIR